MTCVCLCIYECMHCVLIVTMYVYTHVKINTYHNNEYTYKQKLYNYYLKVVYFTDIHCKKCGVLYGTAEC